jgi:hypothetical protein
MNRFWDFKLTGAPLLLNFAFGEGGRSDGRVTDGR